MQTQNGEDTAYNETHCDGTSDQSGDAERKPILLRIDSKTRLTTSAEHSIHRAQSKRRSGSKGASSTRRKRADHGEITDNGLAPRQHNSDHANCSSSDGETEKENRDIPVGRHSHTMMRSFRHGYGSLFSRP